LRTPFHPVLRTRLVVAAAPRNNITGPKREKKKKRKEKRKKEKKMK
jgi:hypothetical protein